MATASLPNFSNSTERWLPVTGYEGYYEVSDFGRVRSLLNRQQNPRREPYLRKLRPNADGYLELNLYKDGAQQQVRVATLVLNAFKGSRPAGTEASHLNGARSDNRAVNLAWESPLTNNRRRQDHGTIPKGSAVTGAKLIESDVSIIRGRILRGDTLRQIARDFGVCHGTITDIKSGHTWSHVPLRLKQQEGE